MQSLLRQVVAFSRNVVGVRRHRQLRSGTDYCKEITTFLAFSRGYVEIIPVSSAARTFHGRLNLIAVGNTEVLCFIADLGSDFALNMGCNLSLGR